MFEVEVYRLENGRASVEDFIRGLDKKMQAKALATIEILSEFGKRLRKPYSKAIGD